MKAWFGALLVIAGFAVGAFSTAVTARMTAQALPSVPTPNAVDIGFSQDMMVHHTQALLMASIVLERPGASTKVRALASQIELTQAEEIGVFRGWLRLWNAPGLSSAPMSWMRNSQSAMAGQPSMSPMPGLATEPELAALSVAQGPALDQLFLKLMLYHHIGGLSMIRAAILGAAMPQVRAVASEMLFEESEEIGYMNQIRQAGSL